MTTKEYLSQISRLDRMIKNKLIELSELKKMAYRLSAISNEERVQSTPNFDKIGDAYCKIESMEESIDKLIDEYAEKKDKIISQIDSMDNEILYDILFSRYIVKNTFEKIADNLNYSYRQTTRLHGEALKEFEKKYGHLYLKIENMS